MPLDYTEQLNDVEAVELEFDNVLSEHLAAERLYYRSTLMWKVDKVVGALMLLAGILLICAAGLVWWSLILIPLAMVVWFDWLSIRPLQVLFHFKRNPKFAETYRLGFDDAEVRFRTDTMDSRISWDHYSSLLENDRLCLLVYGRGMYTVVPKRAFRSTGDLESFRRLVTAKLG